MINTMSLEAVEQRLAEVTEEQRAFDARDLDAELGRVIADGGDVDAVEDAHLEAERQARRLRVERQALEARLPIARAEDAQTKLKGVVDEHSALAEQAEEAAAAIDEAWKTLASHLDRYAEIREQAQAVHAGALKIIDKSGAKDAIEVPNVGAFTSRRVCSVGKGMFERAEVVMHQGENGFPVGPGHAKSYPLD
ncbi:hypothetical protein [Halomonas organivorans]|uniref:Uncharacterized protein n=1 Tax=Halomonas organivorans TaxID=257772 RepID=A0A7W5BXW4_9GAMM|nr:hypothetical protein [Halomonas organivorans]MBB3140218.1 hypothetical protein [Halomonas organivorans]